MRLRKEKKDLDSWVGRKIKIMINSDGFYEGILKEEQMNGILIEVDGKRIYVQFEAITSIEEL